MEGLTFSYWMQRRAKILLPAAVFFAGLLFAMWKPSGNWNVILPILGVHLVLCAPFTFKTAVGRLWWGCLALSFGGGAAAIFLGMHHPLSWIFAEIAACAYGVGVCLRWYPPTKTAIGQADQSRK